MAKTNLTKSLTFNTNRDAALLHWINEQRIRNGGQDFSAFIRSVLTREMNRTQPTPTAQAGGLSPPLARQIIREELQRWSITTPATAENTPAAEEIPPQLKNQFINMS